MVIKFPCNICSNPVGKNHHAIQCDHCDLWVHTKCNKINKQRYNFLKTDDTKWYCLNCTKELFPFSDISDNVFHQEVIGKHIKFVTRKENSKNGKNCFLEELNSKSEIPTKYLSLEEIKNLNNENKDNLSVFHMNINSLDFYYDSLETFFTDSNSNFEIIGITETRIKKSQPLLTNISLPNYNIEQTPTESTKGGALLYIKSCLNYKLRPYLQIYKSKELESIFIEIIHPNKKNMIIGCLYRHPSMNPTEFNEDYLTKLSEKLIKENKDILLMGDFNFDLLKSESNKDTSLFLDLIYNTNLFPTITSPTRLTSRSNTLIDNIFSNILADDSISGNTDFAISDHLGQFLMLPFTFKADCKPKNIYQRNLKFFVEENFLNDMKKVKWDQIINTEKGDTNMSFNTFLKKIENILDNHAPIKKLSLKESKLRSKPWISKLLLKSIGVKNSLYRKFRKLKDITCKEILHKRYKRYKHILEKAIKTSKNNYYKDFFERHKNNSLKTWDGIKSIINVKKNNSSRINSVNINGKIESK